MNKFICTINTNNYSISESVEITKDDFVFSRYELNNIIGESSDSRRDAVKKAINLFEIKQHCLSSFLSNLKEYAESLPK